MGWVIELRKPHIRVPTPWLWREVDVGCLFLRNEGDGVLTNHVHLIAALPQRTPCAFSLQQLHGRLCAVNAVVL
jgi:hypothetical protein